DSCLAAFLGLAGWWSEPVVVSQHPAGSLVLCGCGLQFTRSPAESPAPCGRGLTSLPSNEGRPDTDRAALPCPVGADDPPPGVRAGRHPPRTAAPRAG